MNVAWRQVQAFTELNVKVPVVARVEGTAADEGRELLRGTIVQPAETVQEGAKKIVDLAYA